MPSWGRHSAVRAMVLAMALMTLCLAVLTLWYEGGVFRIGHESRGVLTNAGPSVARLVEARTALRRLDGLMDQELLWRMAGHPPRWAAFEDARRQLREYLSDYGTLPDYPGELELKGRVDQAARQLEAPLRELEQALARSDWAQATQVENGDWRQASDRLDAALVELSTFNLSHLMAHGAQIEATWRLSSQTGIAFSLFTLILAALATRLALQAMRSQLQAEAERSAELELFAGRVAHDLMSPLAAAGAALQLAQRQALSPQVVKATERGLAALGRTRQIMDGLLGFARAGAQVEGAPQTRLGDVLPGILEELSPQAEAAGITLLSEFEPEVRVAANPGVLTVMVSNLLRNAVKHMGPSRVRRVCLRAQVVESRALFEVEDTGPGLPPALHRRVFEPFVRGPATGQPGIGLGLATVKRLVEAHGGQVGVHSAEGGGAVFWFSLPLAPA